MLRFDTSAKQSSPSERRRKHAMNVHAVLAAASFDHNMVLYGSTALNLYMPVAFEYEAKDLDFFYVAETPKHFDLFITRFVECIQRERHHLCPEDGATKVSTQVLFHDPLPIMTYQFTVNGEKIADVTRQLSNEVQDLLEEFPRCVATVNTPFARTPFMMSVVSLGELLHRLACTVTCQPCLDSSLVLDKTKNAWRISKDSKRLDRVMFLQASGFLLETPRLLDMTNTYELAWTCTSSTIRPSPTLVIGCPAFLPLVNRMHADVCGLRKAAQALKVTVSNSQHDFDDFLTSKLAELDALNLRKRRSANTEHGRLSRCVEAMQRLEAAWLAERKARLRFQRVALASLKLVTIRLVSVGGKFLKMDDIRSTAESLRDGLPKLVKKGVLPFVPVSKDLNSTEIIHQQMLRGFELYDEIQEGKFDDITTFTSVDIVTTGYQIAVVDSECSPGSLKLRNLHTAVLSRNLMAFITWPFMSKSNVLCEETGQLMTVTSEFLRKLESLACLEEDEGKEVRHSRLVRKEVLNK